MHKQSKIPINPILELANLFPNTTIVHFHLYNKWQNFCFPFSSSSLAVKVVNWKCSQSIPGFVLILHTPIICFDHSIEQYSCFWFRVHFRTGVINFELLERHSIHFDRLYVSVTRLLWCCVVCGLFNWVVIY